MRQYPTPSENMRMNEFCMEQVGLPLVEDCSEGQDSWQAISVQA